MRKPKEPGHATMTDMVQLGAKLRHARLARRMRIKDVAERAGCSEGMVSKVENGKIAPSLALLHRLVAATGTNVSSLFDNSRESVVTRAGRRPVFSPSEDNTIKMELLTPIPSPTLFQASIHIIPGKAMSDGPIEHEGEDFGYVLEGELEVFVGNQKFRLKAGDTFYFPSSLPHSYKNPSDSTTRVIWFNTPPTF